MMNVPPTPGLFCHDHGFIFSGLSADAALNRLHLRRVPVLILCLTENGTPRNHPGIVGTWTSAGPRELPPRPGLILRAAREAGVDLARSWLIGVTADEARAAGQAGLAGCVLIGDAPGPTEDVGLVVARARDLADAPRVMIPRGGGCWHGI